MKQINNILERISAGVLTLALTVSLIIATLLSSLIFLAYYYRLQFTHYDIEEKLERNTASALAYFLAERENLLPDELYLFDLFDKGSDSIMMQRKRWGIYDLGIIHAFRGTHEKKIAALTGNYPGLLGQAALYLTDNQDPLSIAGNTLIKGDAYLPKAGIKSGHIERQSYVGNKFIDGKSFTSNIALPAFNSQIQAYIQYLLHGQNIEASLSTENIQDSIHSFFQPTIYISTPGSLSIRENLKGNIIIQSSEIRVNSSAILEDVILIAPKVIIEDHFTGKLQVFASQAIEVGKQVHLHYPSTLGLISQEKGAVITLEESSFIEGTVFLLASAPNNHILSMKKQATIRGDCYVQGWVELQGNIEGHLACQSFLLRTPSAVYENHLLNATIDNTKLSRHFVGANLWAASEKKAVVKWLY